MDKPIKCAPILKNLMKKVVSSINRLETSLNKAPDGRIQIRMVKGVRRFYRIRSDGTLEYLGKEKEDLVKALSQKKLDQGLLEASLKEKKALEKALKIIGVETREQVWAKFPEALKDYVQVDESVDEGYIKKWQSDWGLVKQDDEHKLLTERGDYVRSKSEYIIADRLLRAHVPYKYEKPIVFEHGLFVYHPDFTVMNPRTKVEYYWEHFGMTDNENYFAKMKDKLDVYAEYGIYPGKNLIMTFEASKNPLIVEHVDRMIEMYLK